jgi:3-hydroxyacyl-CoA dehydrogenase/enoyl-CoA hydratase/3-hydroxybutyryl-CoA epimerase
MEPAVRTSTDADNVLTILLDVPGKPVNTCTPQVLDELSAVVESLAASKPAGVIIASAKARSFNAGADLYAIRDMDPERARSYLAAGQALFERIARLPMPTVAAINGDCLGGGMELALACTYRVAADDGSITAGLPEVKLGLIPAWRGATWLPRLIGLARALPILLEGKTMPPRTAKECGLIDEVVPPDALRDAAKQRVMSPPKLRRAGIRQRVSAGLSPVRCRVLERARRRVLGQTFGNYPAPLRLLDVVKTGYEHGFEAGLAAEREAILQLMQTTATRNLLRLFFLRQAAKRRAGAQPGKSPEVLVKRLSTPYFREALAAVAEGVAISQVDDAMKRWGMVKGPFELMDEFGMDVVTRTLHSTGEPSQALSQPPLDSGPAGPLTGSTESRNVIPEEDLQWRLVLAMAIEAARALSEGVVDSADDIDLASVFGLGFPPFRGGLAKFIGDSGVDRIVSRLDQMAVRYGPRFAAAELLNSTFALSRRSRGAT